MTRRNHKEAHPECPHKSWAACDRAQQMRYGQCKAITGDREPTPCTRWAVSENGWCWQHHVSELERVKREERIAIRQAELDARINAYLAWTQGHPSVHDSPSDPRYRKGKPYRLLDPAD